MGTAPARATLRGRKALLAGAAGLAVAFASTIYAPLPAFAQDVDFGFQATPGAQMLLEADTLVYDNDRNTISAVGGVRIDYDGYRLAADRITYDRNTSRLIASGNVLVIDRDGNRFIAQRIDITDDFRDGFVEALRVETADETFFEAERAERQSGEVTTFTEGSYTACRPCEESPGKPPAWRIRSQQIIWDGRTRTVRFQNARFEFFGMPIATLPFFEIPDPTVRRKSGFLTPGIRYKSELGVGISVPYYFALSPTYDLTVTGSYYSRQGFLGQAEWRQRFDSGQYNLRVAGIFQQGRSAFTQGADRVNANQRGRGMISTRGEFNINPRWTFGWDAMIQSDKNFARTYDLEGNSSLVRTSQVNLTGLNDRNYFDLRAYHFRVQEDLADSHPDARHPRQPWVLPSFDYRFTPDSPVAGGELNLAINAQVLRRSTLDTQNWDMSTDTVSGASGTSGRLTMEAEWRRNVIGPGGLVLTPLLHGRADAIFANLDAANAAAYGDAANVYGGAPVDIRSSYGRYMATAGLEARWPILFSAPGSSHVLEPVAQIFLRPNEPHGASLGIPNEDAQSLVFDAASLFERDKFSGYDRIEGGTRANLGIRYSGDYGAGWTGNAIFGQSYHLGGRNPFADPDLVHAGAFSGLQTNRSDYVGQIGLGTPVGLDLAVGARFDQSTFRNQRLDATASYSTPFLSLAGRFSQIRAQPNYGFPADRRELSLGGSAQLAKYWRVFASGTYDFQSSTLVNRSIGFAYDDDCFEFALAFNESRSPDSPTVTRGIGLRISLRTLGDFGSGSSNFGQPR